ncbi:MAG: HD domain-containing protein [Bacillota bacterium]
MNEQQEINREFCCHQMQHALDVARIYYILFLEKYQDGISSDLKNMSVDQTKELIYATALLHDIGRWSSIWISP